MPRTKHIQTRRGPANPGQVGLNGAVGTINATDAVLRDRKRGPVKYVTAPNHPVPPTVVSAFTRAAAPRILGRGRRDSAGPGGPPG